MAVQIQLRRGTAAEWASANPVLAEGELAVEIDTGKFKLGNGILHWNNIDYSSGVAGPAGPAGPAGATGTNIINEATDVDISGLTAGSVLVYQTSINKWVASTDLTQQNLDAGEF
jgi:hypothetical protein